MMNNTGIQHTKFNKIITSGYIAIFPPPLPHSHFQQTIHFRSGKIKNKKNKKIKNKKTSRLTDSQNDIPELAMRR